MGKFFLKRILTAIVQIFVVVSIVFFSLQIMPGDPVLMMLSRDGSAVDQEAYDALEAELGLDQPVMTQYTSWLAGLVHGDLGKSYGENRPVVDAIGDRLPRTLELAVVALVVSLTLIVTVVSSKLLGCLLPIAASRLGLDPAVMASPLITTIADAVSLLVYFRIAVLLLDI